MPNLYDGYDTAGGECSSTYEGRHVTFPSSYFVTPLGGLVQQGDPVVVATPGGELVGVAFSTASGANDLVAIDTEGIWALTVWGLWSDGCQTSANKAVAVGDRIYINKTSCKLSLEDDPEHWLPFGWAMDTVATGESDVICVKVHPEFDPLHLLHIGVAGANCMIPVGQRSWLRGYVKPDYEVTGEFVGLYMRAENDDDASTGGFWAAHLKAINEGDTSPLGILAAVMANADTRDGTVTRQQGVQVLCEGVGDATHRTGIMFISRDTAGTATESLFALEIATSFGTHPTTCATPTRCIQVDVAGTVEFLQLYSTCNA